MYFGTMIKGRSLFALLLLAISSLAQADFESPQDTVDTSIFRIPLLGSLESAGFRFSSSDGSNFDGLSQQAVFLDFRLPWRRDISLNSWLTAGLSLEAGTFMRDSETSLFASFGPTIRLDSNRGRVPYFLSMGISPTIIEKTDYNRRDFGTSLNFTSNLAFGLRFGQHKNHAIRFRYQHISNGGIDDDNPGVNMAGIDLIIWAKGD